MKRLGRPLKVADGNLRVPLGLRVTPETKQNLSQAAIISGRSQSQEAELRIELSFRFEQILERLDRIEQLLERYPQPLIAKHKI